jgi:hypothetical protein
MLCRDHDDGTNGEEILVENYNYYAFAKVNSGESIRIVKIYQKRLNDSRNIQNCEIGCYVNGLSPI